MIHIFFLISLIFPLSDSSYETEVQVPADIVPLSVASDRPETSVKVIQVHEKEVYRYRVLSRVFWT